MVIDREFVARERITPLSPLRISDFRLLIFTQLVAGFRQPMIFFTQGWWVTVNAPESQRVLLLGLLATINGVAFLGYVLLGGAFADRHPRRSTLLMAHWAATLVVAGTGALLLIPAVSAGEGPWLYLMLIPFSGFGLLNGQDFPARTALVADVVPDRMLTTAVTLNWLALAATLIIGNYIAGIMLELVGFGATYMLASAGHLATVLLLVRMRLRAGPADVSAGSTSLLRNVRDGLGYLGQDRAVRWAVFVSWLSMLGGMTAVWSLGPVWMRDVLELDAVGWGLMTLFWAVGMLLASILLLARGEYHGKGRLLLGAAATFGIAVLGFSFLRSVAATAVFFVLAGVAFQTQQTVGTAIIQTIVPRHLLGRVMSLLLLSQGLARAAGLGFGAVGQLAGLLVLFPAIGLTMVLGVTLTALVQRPLRTLD